MTAVTELPVLSGLPEGVQCKQSQVLIRIYILIHRHIMIQISPTVFLTRWLEFSKLFQCHSLRLEKFVL